MSVYGKAVGYLVGSGALGFLLMSVATPSADELQRIKDYGGKNKAFSDVLKAAADPSSKPMYLQKSGQQNPLKDIEKNSSK